MAFTAFILHNVPYWVESPDYISWIPGFKGCTPSNSTQWLSLLKDVIHTPDLQIPQQLCYGTMSVYRITFSLAIFHIVLAIIMINVRFVKDFRNDIQNSFWTIKLLALIGVTVGAFFIPNDFFSYYSWFALVGSAIFIFIQLILLVDFAHSWTESWVAKYEKTQSRFWAAALITATGLLYLVSISLTIVMYIFFTEAEKDCWHNPMFITLNLILCFFISIASIHPKLQEKNPRNGLLQSAVVTCYSTYLVWSALTSQPASMKCSKFPVGGSGFDDKVSLIFGVLFTVLALVYSALRVSTSSESLSPKESKRQQKKLLATLAHEDEQPLNINTEKEEDKDEKEDKKEKKDIEAGSSDSESEIDGEAKVPYNFTFFHFTFLLAAMYLGMVLTNWQSISIVTGEGVTDNTILVDQGPSAVWVKIVSSWVTLLLFIWTMIAPVLFPNRKFFPDDTI
jgi:hypothetical protein